MFVQSLLSFSIIVVAFMSLFGFTFSFFQPRNTLRYRSPGRGVAATVRASISLNRGSFDFAVAAAKILSR
jgi:hypothetical protein